MQPIGASRFTAAAGIALLVAGYACSDEAEIVTSTGDTNSTASASGGSGQGGAQGGATSSGGGSGCADCSAPGYLCVGDVCLEDCREPAAVPCDPMTVCDVGSEHPGQCVPPDMGCVVSNPSTTCGTLSCGPGTACDGAGQCYATLPCTSTQCSGDSCWGTNCPCDRPPPTCSPAPLGMPGDAGTLNDYAFSRCGSLGNCDGGIFDLDFDQACNAFGVTMISGTDFLRKITPQGAVSEVAGVTNLNMGEVAAVQGDAGTFGGGMLADVVALSYICCATCGCILTGQSGNPQGVAMWDVMNASLPMMIPTTTFTTGTGPFGSFQLNTGPYGLSWGLDRVLYVGNTDANGEYHALDLNMQNKTLLHTFSERVHASAPLDGLRMLVAVAGGDIYAVPILGATGSPQLLVSLGSDVTSLQRDPWSGQIYASLSDLSIVSFTADGADVSTFQTAPALGRIAIAPDGYLYHLTSGFPTQAAVVRWQLPTSL